jgi:hypothetical protein
MQKIMTGVAALEEEGEVPEVWLVLPSAAPGVVQRRECVAAEAAGTEHHPWTGPTTLLWCWSRGCIARATESYP